MARVQTTVLTIFAAVFTRALAVEADLPLTKVVNLLKDMQKDLVVLAKKDEDSFEAIRCWCETNEKDKNQAVEDQKNQCDQLEALIEGSAGKKGQLIADIADLKNDIAESSKALKEATDIRNKGAAEFHTQEKELLQSIQLLNGAITALSKHHAGASMLQADQVEAEVAAMRPALRQLVHQHIPLLGWLDADQKDALVAFVDAQPDILDPDTPSGSPSFLQRGSLPYKSYAPQSGQIFGVLRQMKEAFEEDLPEIQQDETHKAQTFALMKGEKESEIKQMSLSVKSKQGELGGAKEALFNAKNDLEDTRASLSVDQKFLLSLTERCTQADFEWQRRKTMRSEEIAAVSSAISILTTQEVRDGQQTTFGSSLLQTASRTEGTQRSRAVAMLERMAKEMPVLSLLLVAARSDPFGKVIAAIDGLVAKLALQQSDEVKERDFCIEQLHQNEVDTAKKTSDGERLDAKIEDLIAQGKVLAEAVATLKEEIKTLHVELMRASEDRKRENREFQDTVADQSRTIEALAQAHSKLSEFYFKQATLLQQQKGPTPAPMPEFEDYESNQGGNHVMNLIQKLQGEAKVIRDGARHDEQAAEDAYEQLIAETNDSVQARIKLVMVKSEELSEVNETKERSILEKDQVTADLEALGETLGALHVQCDFTLKNFGPRQDARAKEMEALATVKAIFSGMKG